MQYKGANPGYKLPQSHALSAERQQIWSGLVMETRQNPECVYTAQVHTAMYLQHVNVALKKGCPANDICHLSIE